MWKVPGTLAAWGSGGRGVGWGDAQQGGGAESRAGATNGQESRSPDGDYRAKAGGLK